jgi:hypothetical protein
MDLDSALLLFLPMVAMVALAILIKMSGSKAGTRTRIIGIIAAVTIVVLGVWWRLSQGGF